MKTLKVATIRLTNGEVHYLWEYSASNAVAESPARHDFLNTYACYTAADIASIAIEEA